MELAQPHSFRRSLSLLQMMKLVVFGAIASACVAPAYHLHEIGVGTLPALLILEGVSVPLVLALAAFPLVRKGPLKDWLIRTLLMVSISVALGFAAFMLIFVVSQVRARGRTPEFGFLAADVGIITMLGFALALLGRGIILLKCPDCSRRTLILVAKATVSPEDIPGKPYLCLRCQRHYSKLYGSSKVIRHGLEATTP
jgi:DNA-directed RNA polymerase subunit RPC12/RpoP